jgi:hypothetical protein
MAEGALAMLSATSRKVVERVNANEPQWWLAFIL